MMYASVVRTLRFELVYQFLNKWVNLMSKKRKEKKRMGQKNIFCFLSYYISLLYRIVLLLLLFLFRDGLFL